jgi:GNAT superfamily N-acetyltransferase
MVNIRKARSKDIDRLLELWKRFMEEHREMGREMGDDRVPDMKPDSIETTRTYLSRNVRSRNALLLVLEDEEDIQGYMLSMIQKNIPIFQGEIIGYVAGIYLRDDHRGKGYSSKMFEETRKWFKQKGAHEVTIQVMWCNPHAHKVYQKWGFKDIHTMLRLDLD